VSTVAARAADFAGLAGREISPPVGGPPDWSRAQELVAGANHDGGSLVMLTDPYGRVICHPSMQGASTLRRLDYAEQQVRLFPGDELVELGQLRPSTVLTGTTDFLDGPAAIAVVHLPDLHINVVVIQSNAGQAAMARRMTSGLLWWLGLGGAGVLLLTVVGSVVLVRGYDSVLMRANKRLEQELERRVRHGLEVRNGLIFGLAKLADYRDTDTGGHLERICRYAGMLAFELRGEFPEITPAWIALLKLAASMHDIGKVGISDAELLKPGAFTPAERRLMEQHPVIGADTLEAIRRRVGEDELVNMGIDVTRSHHERYDGAGYPHRLRGDAIPLSARIVALADMYDALTSKRVYKPAMGHDQAREIVRQGHGTHFDPRVVDAFERIHPNFDRVRIELQSELKPALAA